MGVVYEAYDPQIDRTVALKVLRPECCADESSVIRFLREARTIGRVAHPHIVTIYDVGEDRGTLFIAMEYVDGRPLSELMREKRFSREEILDIGIEVAETLDHAHARGVVHRDVKPGNILVQPNGGVKITDFGIAHMEDSACTVQTREGEILGTPAFMSPEQVQGKPVDGRSDLFSLGVVLYQLTTGRRPFGDRGSTLASLLHAIVYASPAQPVELRPDLDPTLNRIILKCLSKDPAGRYATGAALAGDLRECRRRRRVAVFQRFRETLGHPFSAVGFVHALLIAAFSLAAALLYFFPQPSADVAGSRLEDSRKGTSVSSPPARTENAPGFAMYERKRADSAAIPLPLGEGRRARPDPNEGIHGDGTDSVKAPDLSPAAESQARERSTSQKGPERSPGAVLLAAHEFMGKTGGTAPAGPSLSGLNDSARVKQGKHPADNAEDGKTAVPDPSPEVQVLGILEISSTPSRAEVLVDGVPMGTTPFVARIPPGERLVTVRSSDHDPWERRFNVEAGRHYPFEAVLQKSEEESLLAVVSEPSRARVFVNEVEKGLTPATLKLPAGRHTVKIKRNRYKDFETQVVVTRSDKQSIQAKLTPLQGKTKRVARSQPPPPHPVSSLVSQVRYQLSPQTLWRRVRSLF